jgi:hypothetical protein
MERFRGEGGSGAKERRTLSLIFRCALGQPSGKPGWVGIMMALVAWNRRTPGWESGTSPSREMRASEAKSKQQAWLIARAREKQHTLEARAEGYLTKRGGAWAGQPPRRLGRIIGPERAFVLRLLRRGRTLSIWLLHTQTCQCHWHDA